MEQPTPPDPEEPPATPPASSTSTDVASSKRPWTILGRLSKAVREQNWFAVGLEVVIVIVGVIIGFQVTAWGQARSNVAREEILLRQVIADLDETERVVRDVATRIASKDRANAQLIRAFSSDVVPPADSILQWRYDADTYHAPTPTIGSLEALVSSGDLVLIRDPTLRSAITAYLDLTKRRMQSHSRWEGRFIDGGQRADNRFDFAEIVRGARSVQSLDSLAATDPLFTDVPGDRTAFPFDPKEIIRDREMYRALRAMHAARKAMRGSRTRMLDSAVDLREQIEAHLGR
ncbi:MAG: hypothetical protein Rubg2KO_18180 [Rubricoccaceae bacterium]